MCQFWCLWTPKLASSCERFPCNVQVSAALQDQTNASWVKLIPASGITKPLKMSQQHLIRSRNCFRIQITSPEHFASPCSSSSTLREARWCFFPTKPMIISFAVTFSFASQVANHNIAPLNKLHIPSTPSSL